MTKAYINYPNAHIGIHTDPACRFTQCEGNSGQRHIQLNRSSLSVELDRFAEGHYPFRAEARMNDMWLIIDFDDPIFEKAVVEHIKTLIGKRYRPIRECAIRFHC